MLNINLQSKNIDLAEDIKDYVLKKVTNLEKFLNTVDADGGEVYVNFELSKSTNHHKAGEVFHADCSVNINGDKFYASADAEDERSAIDEIKEKIFRDISKRKDREQTLFKRGATSVKKMLKGLSKRNPFTSKY